MQIRCQLDMETWHQIFNLKWKSNKKLPITFLAIILKTLTNDENDSLISHIVLYIIFVQKQLEIKLFWWTQRYQWGRRNIFPDIVLIFSKYQNKRYIGYTLPGVPSIIMIPLAHHCIYIYMYRKQSSCPKTSIYHILPTL